MYIFLIVKALSKVISNLRILNNSQAEGKGLFQIRGLLNNLITDTQGFKCFSIDS